MEYLSLKDQLVREREKSAALLAANARNEANIDYVAMMCDIELEPDKSDGAGEEV